MKRFIIAFVAIAAITLTVTACTWTSEEKAAAVQTFKSALAQTGVALYEAEGRAKLESWLSDQVSSGKITEAQKTAALAAADKGVSELAAYLESTSTSSQSATATAAITGTTATSTTDASATATATVSPTATSDATAKTE